jgi:predicted tellurium resistance membrane protein TerC
VELLADPRAWAALATLTARELVLGIDNIVFISILVDKLPHALQELSWVSGLVAPLFTLAGQEISGRDLVMIVGGLFLIYKGIGRFVSDHPTIKMLALSFLVVVGVALIAEGFDQRIPKGYVYFAMAIGYARVRRRPRTCMRRTPGTPIAKTPLRRADCQAIAPADGGYSQYPLDASRR